MSHSAYVFKDKYRVCPHSQTVSCYSVRRKQIMFPHSLFYSQTLPIIILAIEFRVVYQIQDIIADSFDFIDC